jgi:hypothetical protein
MASNNGGTNGGRSNRGFAAMDPNEQRAIARKGGEAVSQNREHMAAIGRKGGEASGGGNRGRSENEVTRDREGQFMSGRGESSSRGLGESSSRGMGESSPRGMSGAPSSRSGMGSGGLGDGPRDGR